MGIGKGRPSAPPAVKSASVRAFMAHMYFTASEPMPTAIASKQVLDGADDDLRQELLDRLVDSRLVGTSLTLTGAIVHGFGVYIYIGDEGLSTGSSWTIECAMRSIDRAYQQARAKNAPFPWELWLQGDNCPKEVRNSFTGKWGCLLAQANFFVGVSHHHMVVGHTHEDIDGVFSLVTAALNAENGIETPRDIQRTILRRLTPAFQKKGLVLEVELIDTIRNWAKLMPTNSTLRNCYRSRKNDAENNMRVPQSFSFFPREGAGDRKDIFALVKGNMAVVAEKNLGDHIFQLYGANTDGLKKVIEHLVIHSYRGENEQFSAHIKEFMSGYRQSAEAVLVKFPRVDQTRNIIDFSVGYNDGQLKEFQEEDLEDPAVSHMLQSFRYVRCLPLDVLQGDWWVPGSTSRADLAKYSGKAQWQEILQNDEEKHQFLFDICCVWQYLQPKMKSSFPMAVLEKYNQMFFKGNLDSDLGGLVKAGEEFDWERISFVLEDGKGKFKAASKAGFAAGGIVGAAKYEFILTALTNLLTLYKRNGVAVVIHPNRASQLQVPNRKSEAKKEEIDAKEEVDDDQGGVKRDLDDDDDDTDDKEDAKEEADVRDIRYNLEKDLSAKDRNLSVRSVTWVFAKDSIYGRRDGAITGVAVVHQDKGNIYRKSSLWKQGVVDNVQMLPRANMFKPVAVQSKANLPHLGRALTDVQELKQVAGGTDFVEQTLASLKPQTVSTTLMLDLHCYDGWPALAVLQEAAREERILCGSVVLDQRPDGLQQYLANAVYESCRSKQLKLKAFPDFSQYIQSLKDVKPESTGHEYQVCTKRGTTLCVLGSYASKWLESEQFKGDATAIIQQHNQKYNPEGDFVEEAQDRTEDRSQERAPKRIKLESDDKASDADVTALKKAKKFQINSCAELVTDEEAAECCQDTGGRWYSFSVNMDSVFLLEKKHLPSHLTALPAVDTPTPLRELVLQLEDAGEVKLGVSHHTLEENAVRSDKPLVFVLDNRKDPEEEEKNKKRKRGEKNKGSGGPTFKNFGAYVQTIKIKGSSKISIGWRVRHIFEKCNQIIFGLLIPNIYFYIPKVCIMSLNTLRQLLFKMVWRCLRHVFMFPTAPGLIRRPMGPKCWSLSGRLGSRLA
ncbi:unnamed protein product [Cladocopium goreaui]|uniref:DUF7869 domain-containing protein n=1 Tax=Cladocopium goreaui TaxID=2562237 RepID=A0A9P1FFW0_9DINO|nr:unnamed protein product [Cladocopium goreaui]